MLIAIISDTHDNIPNLKKVLDYCRENKVEKIIHCGDLAEIETLDFLCDNFAGEIFLTLGNMDRGHVAAHDFPQNTHRGARIFREFGQADFAGIRTAFVHFPDVARQLCETNDYDLVFYGHTHKPWDEKVGNCRMLNPGNVANQYYPPTFAIWETEANLFELIRINDLP